jgi:hypothetical protein
VKPEPTKEMLEAIEAAEKINPDFEFVVSCREFLEERGYLTTKQMEALGRVQPERPYIDRGARNARGFGADCPNGMFSADDDAYDDGVDSTDWGCR